MNEENTSQEKKVIEIASQLSAIEMQGTDNEPLLCERPAEFKPFRAAHQGKLIEGLVSSNCAAATAIPKALSARPVLSRLHTATTASSRLRTQTDGEASTERISPTAKTPPSAAGNRNRKLGMQKAALSPKRKGGRHTPKRHSYQSIFKSTPTTSSEGDDVAAGGDGGAGDGVSAGGAGADAGAGNQAQSGDFEHDEEELQQEGGEKAAGRELDPEMRSALNQFVSAVGSISTSFKNSFSFKRPSNRTVPINDSDDDNDKNELDKVMAQSRAIKAASGAHSSGAQTPKLTPKYSARKGVAGDYMEALAMANCALDATPRDNTSVGRLTPAVSIADSSHISQQSSCQVTPTGTGAAASTAGVFPKAVPRKRASYLGSFLSFGGFGASEKNSPSLTPGAGPAGGESRKHPSGSVMGAVSHMFNGLFSSASASGSSSGRKHSNSDLNNGGSRVGKKADFQVPLRTEPLLQ